MKPHESILAHMRLADNVYVLSPHERPVNVLYQQRRAVNLAWALEQSASHRSHTIAIVGGGIAGLTCSAYLGRAGFKVHVIEKSPRLLYMFADSIRYLHPRIYDWPNQGFLEPTSDLPLMNWSSGLACDVSDNLLKQFQGWTAACGIRTLLGTRATESGMEASRPVLKLRNRRGERTRAYDIVLLAAGFGDEKFDQPGLHGTAQPWWQLDGTYIDLLMEKDLAIVGTGDGGLSDLLESIGLSQPTLGSPEWIAALRNQNLLDGASAIEEWIKKNDQRDEVYKNIEKKYDELDNHSHQVDTLLERAIKRLGNFPLRRIMHGKVSTILNPGTYPLNRYLVSRLLKVSSNYLTLSYNTQPPGSAGPTTPSVLRPGPNWRFSEHEPDFPGWKSGMKSIINKSKISGSSLTKPQWSTWSSASVLGSGLPPGMDRSRLKVMSTFYNPEPQRMAFDRMHHDVFRKLYLGRIRRDILIFDKIVFTDAQILDGYFFRRHLEDVTHLHSHIEIATRKDTLRSSLDEFVVEKTPKSGAKRGRNMLFWSLPNETRMHIESNLGTLQNDILDRGAEAALMSLLPGDREVRDICRDWGKMLGIVEGWAKIRKSDAHASLANEDVRDGTNSTVPSARERRTTDERRQTFSDLGALCSVLRTEEARLLASEIWRAPAGVTRNSFDQRIRSLDPADADGVRMWMYHGYDAVLARDYNVPAMSTLWVTPLDEVTPANDGEVHRLPDCLALGSLTVDEFSDVLNEMENVCNAWRGGQIGWQEVWRTWRSLPVNPPEEVGGVTDSDEWGRRCSSWLDRNPQLECWSIPGSRDTGIESPRVLIREIADGRTASLTTISSSLWRSEESATPG